MSEITILGIDPGSRQTGYGVIRSVGSSLSFVAAGTIKACREERDEFPDRLATIYRELTDVISTYSPTVAAMETLFFAKNALSALKLGHARGAAMLAAVHGELEIYEYTPLEIKQSVTGYGKAEKEQVKHMVRLLLNIKTGLQQDASDALATAICHASNAGMEKRTGQGRGGPGKSGLKTRNI